MPSLVPLYPRILFGILDPIMLAYLALKLYLTPNDFLASQSSLLGPNSLTPLTPPIISTLAQLANVYLVVGALYVMVCHITTDPKVVKGFFIIVTLVDVGHIFSIYMGMGGWKAGFGDLGKWGGAEWINVGGPLFMMINKVGTFMEVFGEIGGEKRGKQSGVEKKQ